MMTLLMFMGGLALLIAGAEALVRGAGKLAISVGVSPLVVGLTVVAFGTSSPEMAVSVQSALTGKVDIAIGNVVGSNIFNVWFKCRDPSRREGFLNQRAQPSVFRWFAIQNRI